MNPTPLDIPAPRRWRVPAWLVAAAACLVLAVALGASFRRGLADDLVTAWIGNGPRVLLCAAAGAALGLSGSLRTRRSARRPLFEVEVLVAGTGLAAGGWWLSRGAEGMAALVLFVVGGTVASASLLALVRWLDRPKRWTNLALLPVLASAVAMAAFAGTYVRERSDILVSLVSWLLGDLNGASLVRSSLLLVLVVALAVVPTGAGAATDGRWVETVALGLGVGAAGPLAFVGTMAPRTVAWLVGEAAPGRHLWLAMLASAATVSAVDAVPRLLLGGYDFPWNVPATMLALPIFLGWNRTRLRCQVGPASLAFEAFEVFLLVAITVGASMLAARLTQVIHLAT